MAGPVDLSALLAVREEHSLFAFVAVRADSRHIRAAAGTFLAPAQLNGPGVAGRVGLGAAAMRHCSS